jgi:hypothetical protein
MSNRRLLGLRLEELAVGALLLTLLLIGQQWSFALYRLGFVMLWLVVLAQIVISNAGPGAAWKQLLAMAAVVTATLGILVAAGIAAAPLLISLGQG